MADRRRTELLLEVRQHSDIEDRLTRAVAYLAQTNKRWDTKLLDALPEINPLRVEDFPENLRTDASALFEMTRDLPARDYWIEASPQECRKISLAIIAIYQRLYSDLIEKIQDYLEELERRDA